MHPAQQRPHPQTTRRTRPPRPRPHPLQHRHLHPQWDHRTYHELADHTTRLLRHGETVILDASWTSQQHRDLLTATAAREHATLTALRCHAPQTLTFERIRTRTRNPSDADTAIAAAMSTHTDPWPQATTINTAGPLTTALTQALTTIRPHNTQHLWPHRPTLSPD
ncbi:AAA family ATPase [Actinomadura chibensis]|uniref:AAA family ATPase n=1 Tax=Actinomadura chibensis TaxID=392828 RepID=UPI0009FCE901